MKDIINEVNIDGSVFHLRGLYVGEYLNFVISDKLANTELFYIQLAKRCLKGWDNVNIVDYSKPLYELIDLPGWPNLGDEYKTLSVLEFSEENIDLIDYEILLRLGQKVFNEFTMLSDQEVKYFQGATRFLNYISNPKNKTRADKYDCNECLRKNHRKNRICNKFSDEDAQRIRSYLLEQDGEEDIEDSESEVPEEKKVKKLKNRYRTVRNTKMVSKAQQVRQEQEQPAISKGAPIKINGFIFEECPVSWIPDWVRTLAGVFYHCSQSKITFFSGGICDQPYKFYMAERVVDGENSKIEREEMEANEKKGNKSRGRR
jgi:hypothetical protein